MNGKKTAIVINEQHNLLAGQLELLQATGFDWNIFGIPAGGLTISEQENIALEIGNEFDVVVFVSPIPYLLARLSSLIVKKDAENQMGIPIVPVGVRLPERIFLFTKEKREKKEYKYGEDGKLAIETKLNDEFVLVEIPK